MQPPIPIVPAHAIDERLSRIESMLAQLQHQLDQALPMAAMTMDIVDEVANDAVARGVDPVERVKALVALVETLSEPDTVNTLQGILRRVDRVEPLLEVVDQLPGLAAMAVDIFDEAVGRAVARGVDVQQALESGAKGFVKLGEFVLSEQFASFLDSGILDPESVSLVGRVGRALADVASEPSGAPGLLGLLREGRQEDVRRALHFGVRFGGRFGQLLRKQIGR